MHSLTAEIQSFSRSRLRKQCTRVTSLSGRRIVETWRGCTVTVEEVQEEEAEGEEGRSSRRPLGYVPDTSWDLQVGAVGPHLLLGSQDAAHDFATLRKHKVSHILNVAYGVENVFPDLFIYKTVSIQENPEADLLQHLPECCHFIQRARAEKGVVLVHCNAGVSRAPAVVVAFLMSCEGHSFDAALSLVQSARPAAAPNPGFVEQLRRYQNQLLNGSKH